MAKELNNWEDFESYEQDMNMAIHMGITEEQKEQIDMLLERATISYERMEYIRKNISSYSERDAEELIRELYTKQVEPISGGFNYGQKDIINKLNNK